MQAWPFPETGGQAGTVGGGCVATSLLLSLSERAPSSAQWLCSQSAFTGLRTAALTWCSGAWYAVSAHMCASVGHMLTAGFSHSKLFVSQSGVK